MSMNIALIILQENFLKYPYMSITATKTTVEAEKT
jgi:hypothetical protein